jgi:hypothetical protein
MKNFIDFIVDAQFSQPLASDFLSTKTEAELTQFFVDNKYAVVHADILKILQVKNNLNLDSIGPGGVVPLY